MNAQKVDFARWYTQDYRWLVPCFQRSYSWSREQCERLLEDILHSNKKKEADRRHEGHFIGCIVYVDSNARQFHNDALLVDGQQRLTTLTLMLLAIFLLLKEKPTRSSIEEDVLNKIQKRYLFLEERKGDEKYKLCLTDSDRKLLFDLLENRRNEVEEDSVLCKNFDYFLSRISRMKHSLTSLFRAIGSLQLVSIKLEEGEDPQAIFESLNSTGVPLEQADLVRNHLLLSQSFQAQEELYRNYWLKMEQFFSLNDKSRELTNFFRDYLILRTKVIAKKDEVYDAMKRYNEEKVESSEVFCKDLYEHARIYTMVRHGRTMEKDPELQAWYASFSNFRVDVIYPLLLRFHWDFEQKKLSREDLIQLLRLCMSVLLRRAICGRRSNRLQNALLNVLGKIELSNYVEKVQNCLLDCENGHFFPTDAEVMENIEKQPIYKTWNSYRLRILLTSLEQHKNKIHLDLSKLSIEHVMPQKIGQNSAWREVLVREAERLQKDVNQLHEETVHLLGNLTLSAYNQEMSNKSFHEKLEMRGGYIDMGLNLNRYIRKQEQWGIRQIQERSVQLGRLFCEVWPYPNLTEESRKVHQASKAKPNYKLEDREFASEYNLHLFRLQEKVVLSMAEDIEVAVRKLYDTYTVEKRAFLTTEMCASGLNMVLLMSWEEFDTQFASEVGDVRVMNIHGKGRHGPQKADLRLTVRNDEELELVRPLIRSAYERARREARGKR